MALPVEKGRQGRGELPGPHAALPLGRQGHRGHEHGMFRREPGQCLVGAGEPDRCGAGIDRGEVVLDPVRVNQKGGRVGRVQVVVAVGRLPASAPISALRVSSSRCRPAKPRTSSSS